LNIAALGNFDTMQAFNRSEKLLFCSFFCHKLHFFPILLPWHNLRLPLPAFNTEGAKFAICKFVNFSFKPKIDTSMANKVNVTPLHDRVIVKPAAAEEKTAGGIIIPDTAKEKPQRGTVIAAGPGKKDEPVQVKEGDTVLYGKYAGTEISIEGEDYLIMRESDILAIV
jgi:chaperonin GroES